MANPQARNSFSKPSPETSAQSSGGTPEAKGTEKRKLSQKRRTLLSMGGHLSPWPTYTSGQTILYKRKPCSDDSRNRANSWQQQPLSISKPRYLEQLENYLRKELLLLDLSTDSAQELRLQRVSLCSPGCPGTHSVDQAGLELRNPPASASQSAGIKVVHHHCLAEPYREIFEFFIEDFKTYKPLLSSIKNAYEVMLGLLLSFESKCVESGEAWERWLYSEGLAVLLSFESKCVESGEALQRRLYSEGLAVLPEDLVQTAPTCSQKTMYTNDLSNQGSVTPAYQTGLELKSTCLCLPSAGIKGVRYHRPAEAGSFYVFPGCPGACFVDQAGLQFRDLPPLCSAGIKGIHHHTRPTCLCLAHQREKIRSLEPLKAKIVTMNEDCSERILAMRAEERHEISVLKKEKMNLLKLIDKKNEEKISLQSEVAKLRKSLAEEYLRYLTERDARKILIGDLNELRYQREDMSLAQNPGDLTRTQMELNTMKANFGDVVPRRDFEMQEKTNMELQEQLESLRADYEEVRKEHEMLLQLHMSTLKERDQFSNELQEIQRTSTPRPDWTKCESVIAGGAERWLMLAEGKNSDQLVDVLLEEIGMGLLREKDFFPGLGFGDSIPPFLRFDGPVKNKKPSKKEVVNLLKDAWKERIAEEQKESFPDFFFNFLERRFGVNDAMAWAYTIFENIKLFRSSEIMSQFYSVLMGKNLESVYINQRETLSHLLKELISADTQNEGLITMEQLSTVLRSTFPLKKEDQIQELMEAAGWGPDSSNTDMLNYRALFSEDEEGQSEPLVQKLWEQYENEKEAYLGELRQELGLEPLEEVSLLKMRGTLMTIDPTMDRQTLSAYLSQAYQIPAIDVPLDDDERQGIISIKVETAFERLKMADTKRVGPREPEPVS
ncbi:Translin-associated factor X-interacting protein 1 [Apodemus speciosus]|uniref:Translin-associated factor X-interacting protein 1 n=1 Tax=Apodemus speciosus TaxID=105296 RepID=A0ABQ0F331_APOSI